MSDPAVVPRWVVGLILVLVLISLCHRVVLMYQQEGTDDWDVESFLVASAASEVERLETRVRAKGIQIRARSKLYEETTATLELEMDRVERELSRCTRTSDERPWLERRLDSLRQDLVEELRRYQAALRELEDELVDAKHELVEVQEAEKLLEEVERVL